MLTFEINFEGRAHAPQANTNTLPRIIPPRLREDNLYTDDVPETSKERHWKILLAALQLGPVTTLMAREELGVQAVAQRVLDLRSMGYAITTRRIWQVDSAGRRHRIGQYVLQGGAA